MYLRWLAYAPLSFALNIVTYPLAPFLALLSIVLNKPVLPWPLRLFHTHDDTLDGGQHQLGWPPVKGFKLWLQRTKWIMRNPAYGFDAYVFGFSNFGMKVIEDDVTGDWGEGRNNGSRKYWAVMQAANGKKYFMYFREIGYGKRYVKIFIGWGLWSNSSGRHMLKVDFHPYKSR